MKWPTTPTLTKKIVSTITPALAPTPRRRPRPSLRELERQESQRREREWENEVNAGPTPPRWLPRRPGWLSAWGRWLDR